jgi:hypothetical protein
MKACPQLLTEADRSNSDLRLTVHKVLLHSQLVQPLRLPLRQS